MESVAPAVKLLELGKSEGIRFHRVREKAEDKTPG